VTAGLFVTLEGVEGAGKSTLADALEERLRAIGHTVVRLREPGGTSLGEAVRSVVLDPAHGDVCPWAELFLMLAARAQVVHERIEPDLAAGRTVICDRFIDASTAYQGAGRGLGIERVQELNRLATRGRSPDLTLLLDLDPAAGRRRQHDRPDRMEQADLQFHRAVRDGYRSIASAEPRRFVVLDAALPASDVARSAWEALTARFPDRIGHVTDR